MYRVRDRIVSRAIADRFGHDRRARILDIGSGTGFYLRMWRRLGFSDVTGSDLTSTSVAALRNELPDIKVTQFDVGAAEVPFEPRSFDAISAMDVLQHVVNDDNYRRAVSNCAHLLRPGGTLFFSDYLAPIEHRTSHEAVRTRADVMATLSSAGFEIAETTPLFVIMNNPICARPIFSKLWRVMVAPARFHEAIGWTLGALLYPFERILTQLPVRGPNAKLIVCTLREA